jgi:hypothetical protein
LGLVSFHLKLLQITPANFIGIFTFIAVKGVAQGLRAVVSLTEVHSPQPLPRIPLPVLGKEDAIATSSLEVLATCDNFELRKAATAILCERFFKHEPSRKKLRRDLNSRNEEVRRRAKQAVKLLRDSGTLSSLEELETGERDRDGLGFHSWMDMESPEEGRLRERVAEGGAAAERDLRRRRREAVIIHDSDRPLSHEDVYMRDTEGRMAVEE